MLFAALIVVLAVVGLVAVVFFIPMWNKLFDCIWEDPSAREMRAIRKRLAELHIDGHVPEEVALLMASREMGRTERELLEAAQLLSAADIKGMVSGQTSILGVMLHGIERAVRRGVKRA